MKRRRNGMRVPVAGLVGALAATLFFGAFGPELVRYFRIKRM